MSILSYGLGCFSTARLLAKSFKNLNIYKVGTGYADTENIYSNISKLLGILAGAIDILKVLLYLILLAYIHSYLNFSENILTRDITLFIFGFFMILGHTLPITHGFKGGRGIFNYSGLILFFAPIPMISVLALSFILILFFKQIRFSNFIIVLLPPIIAFFCNLSHSVLVMMAITAIIMGILNLIVSKQLGEI